MDRLPLLAAARAARLTLYVDGGRLLVRGPRWAEPLARELLARQREVLSPQAPPASPARFARPVGEDRVVPDAEKIAAPVLGKPGIPRYRVEDTALSAALDERRAFDDREVLRRV